MIFFLILSPTYLWQIEKSIENPRKLFESVDKPDPVRSWTTKCETRPLPETNRICCRNVQNQISTHHRALCYTRVPCCAVPGSRASSITSTTPSHTVLIWNVVVKWKIHFSSNKQTKKNQLWNKKKSINRCPPMIWIQNICPSNHLIWLPTIYNNNLDAEPHQRFICLNHKPKNICCGKKCPVLQFVLFLLSQLLWHIIYTHIHTNTRTTNFYNVFHPKW